MQKKLMVLFASLIVAVFLAGTVSSASPSLGVALDNTKLKWTTTSGDYYTAWKGNTSYSHDGVDAAESSTFNYGSGPSQSKLQTTVYGPGTLKFSWMKFYYVSFQDSTYVNAYGSCLLYFSDNGKMIYSMNKYSANSIWSQKSYTMGPGKHVLTWNTVLNCPANLISTPVAYWHWNSLSAYVDQVKWTQAPKLISTIPTNLKTGVSRTNPVLVKFSSNVQKGSLFKTISINQASTGAHVTTFKSISGNTLKISHTKFAPYTSYKVTIYSRAIKDYAGNNLASSYTFKFKTGTI